LAEGLHGRGHRSVYTIEQPEELASLVRGQVTSGDIVVCLGAGTISAWAYALPGQLASLDGKGSA
jgi:UDP-N-acetylmuramate--alanine ligase